MCDAKDNLILPVPSLAWVFGPEKLEPAAAAIPCYLLALQRGSAREFVTLASPWHFRQDRGRRGARMPMPGGTTSRLLVVLDFLWCSANLFR